VGDHPLVKMIEQQFMALIPQVPQPEKYGYHQVSPSSIYECASFSIGFNSSNGAINHLVEHSSQRSWADDNNLLGLFQYQTYTGEDYTTYIDTYGYCSPCPWWFDNDFGKPNVSIADPEDKLWTPSLETLWMRREREGGCSFLVELQMPEESYTKYGSAPTLWHQIDVEAHDRNEIRTTLTILNKTATRLPEALWVTFNPVPQTDNAWLWSLQKLGEPVDPNQVVLNGSHHIHAVESVSYSNGIQRMDLSSYDVALVVPGQPSAFPIPLDQEPDIQNYGVNFNIYNNIWGTNYIMWYPFLEEDASSLYRFHMSFHG